jgi:hypothetical protein
MRHCLITIILFGVVSSSFAQSQLGREFTQLQEQQAKAVAAALEPVNRRYQLALETLLRRATQASDLQTAVLVSDELKKLGVSTSGASGQKSTVSADSFEKRLIGTKWIYFGAETITFLEDGKAKWKENPVLWPWKVKNSGLRVIEGENLNKKTKWTITFDRDLKTGTIEGDGNRTIHRLE